MLYAQLFVKTPRANHQNKTKINAWELFWHQIVLKLTWSPNKK
jgi:hypothetical protein